MRLAVLLVALVALHAGPAKADPSEPGFDRGLTRVVGGKASAAGAWPSQVRIYGPDPVGRGRLRSLCGGTVIGSTWVLTAAHCFVTPTGDGGRRQSVGARDVALVAGVARLPSAIAQNDPVATRALRAKRVIYHPQFDPKTFANDIAVVELDRATETPAIPLVGAQDRARELEGLAATVVGWGFTEESQTFDASQLPADLQEVELPLVSIAECRAAYSESALKGNAIDERSLCAGFRLGGRDACSGDSGGPLMMRVAGGGWAQSGVVSWGEGCAREGRFGVYSRVAAFDDWIRQATRGEIAPAARPSEAYRLSADDAVLAALAPSEDGQQLFSMMAATDIARTAASVPPGDRALVIGIDGYPAPLTLKGSANDAAAITALLVEQLGFRREQVLTLTNESATRSNILTAFDAWLAQGSRPGSRVFLYYSGQGFQSRAFPRLREGRPGPSMAPVDLELVRGADGKVADVAKAVTAAEIGRFLGRLSDRAVTGVFDTTQMSRRELQRPGRAAPEEIGAVRSVEAVVDLAPGLAETVWPPSGPGIEAGSSAALWFAAAPDQWAIADLRAERPMGVFTQRFVNAMQGLTLLAGGGQGRLTDVLDAVRLSVDRFCDEAGRLCRTGLSPQLLAPKAFENVAALASARGSGPVARSASVLQNPAGVEVRLDPRSGVARVTADKPGYVIVVDVQQDGRLTQIFPDLERLRSAGAKPDNELRAKQSLAVPLSGARPGGFLVAILSDKPVQAVDLPDGSLDVGDVAGGLVRLHEHVRSLYVPDRASGRLSKVAWSFNAKPYAAETSALNDGSRNP